MILVEPQLGENIGFAARAMANFGLTELRLIAPRDGWPSDKARAAASKADHVIDAAVVFDTLEAAIADLGFVFAKSTGSGRSGVDVENTPGLAIEVKAWAEVSPRPWLKQAETNADGNLPFVVFRVNGQGEANVGEWGVMLTLDHMTDLLRDADYLPEVEG